MSITTHLDRHNVSGFARDFSSAEAACNASEPTRKALASKSSWRRVQNVAPPVFIHSSWRTSSTWFWQAFRRLPATICFYEPFHEWLATLTRDQALEHSPRSWNSGHPKGDPYFLEYAPLLRKSGGMRIYQTPMAYEWYLPPGGLNGDARPVETKYLSLLLRYGGRLGRTPVLGFTRSLGRLSPIKKQFGGTQIFLHRNLWHQWASYLSQKTSGNAYFFNTLFLMTEQKHDKVLFSLHNYYLGRAIELYLSKTEAKQIVLPRDNFQLHMLAFLPDHDVFAMFMALHIYLYLHAQQQADIVVDVTRLASDHAYRADVEEEVQDRTKLPIRLSDIADVQQFNCMDVNAINWQEINDHAGLAVGALSSFYERDRLQQNATDIIAATAAEMRLSEKYLRGARLRAAALLAENRKLSDSHSALAGELDDITRAHDAALAEHARISQERDALADEHDQILRQRDALIVERDELSRQRDAVIVERDELVRQRDAIIVDRDEFARQRDAVIVERDEFARQRDAVVIEREELSLQRDALSDDCAMIAAERDRAVAEREKLADESRRWFEATIAVGDAGWGGAMPYGAPKSVVRSRPRDLGTICQWRRQKRSIASARRASAAHKWEIAARYYCEAIDYAPRKAALWVQYGHALKEAGKLEAGEYAYRRSLECDDRIADTHLQLAHVLALQNRASEASESYLRSLRLEPHSHDAIYGLLALGWTAETLRSELRGDRPRENADRTRERTPPTAVS